MRGVALMTHFFMPFCCPGLTFSVHLDCAAMCEAASRRNTDGCILAGGTDICVCIQLKRDKETEG